MKSYEIEYNSIVKKRSQTSYRGPERQASAIRKCSILKQTKEIEYNSILQNTKKINSI